jgi:hypothetical protein
MSAKKGKTKGEIFPKEFNKEESSAHRPDDLGNIR